MYMISHTEQIQGVGGVCQLKLMDHADASLQNLDLFPEINR